MARRIHSEGTISERKDGTYEGKISLGVDADGKRKRKTVYGKTQKEVLAKVDAIKQQLANGTFSDTKLTVKGYLEQWLKEKERQIKVRTASDYRYNLEKYVVPKIGGVKLTKLTPLKIQVMLSEIADEVSADRANKCRRVLHGALKQALRWQLITRNPVEAVDAMKHTRAEMRLWNAEEAARFLDTTRGHRLYALFYLAMSTGLRCGELLGLEWGDIRGETLQVNRSLIHMRGKLVISTPKTKKGHRRVALSPDVLEVLEAYRQRQEGERQFLGAAWPGHNTVFTSTVGTYIHPRNLARTWHILQEQAGVPRGGCTICDTFTRPWQSFRGWTPRC